MFRRSPNHLPLLIASPAESFAWQSEARIALRQLMGAWKWIRRL